MVQLRGWMIPAEAFPGKFVTLKGACGKQQTTTAVRETFDEPEYFSSTFLLLEFSIDLPL